MVDLCSFNLFDSLEHLFRTLRLFTARIRDCTCNSNCCSIVRIDESESDNAGNVKVNRIFGVKKNIPLKEVGFPYQKRKSSEETTTINKDVLYKHGSNDTDPRERDQEVDRGHVRGQTSEDTRQYTQVPAVEPRRMGPRYTHDRILASRSI